MKLLLDTRVFLWAIAGDPRLSHKHRTLFEDESNDLFLSMASVWELLIKTALGKLALPEPAARYVFHQMDRNRIATLAIRPHIGSSSKPCRPIHRDPFDRMLVAQARAEGYTVLTADAAIRKYGVRKL